MAIPSLARAALGSWSGSSRLNMVWLPADPIKESLSTLEVSTDPQNTYTTVSYTWAYEGQPMTGMLILAGSKTDDEASAQQLSGGWTDSWHQNAEIMTLVDVSTSEDVIRLQGSYGPDTPKWGWRLELEMTGDDKLSFRMVNMDPAGPETWAVDASYQRTL